MEDGGQRAARGTGGRADGRTGRAGGRPDVWTDKRADGQTDGQGPTGGRLEKAPTSKLRSHYRLGPLQKEALLYSICVRLYKVLIVN